MKNGRRLQRGKFNVRRLATHNARSRRRSPWRFRDVGLRYGPCAQAEIEWRAGKKHAYGEVGMAAISALSFAYSAEFSAKLFSAVV